MWYNEWATVERSILLPVPQDKRYALPIRTDHSIAQLTKLTDDRFGYGASAPKLGQSDTLRGH